MPKRGETVYGTDSQRGSEVGRVPEKGGWSLELETGALLTEYLQDQVPLHPPFYLLRTANRLPPTADLIHSKQGAAQFLFGEI